MKSRIQPIDGLRMIAAFGVIWIHTWSYFGNPSLKIGPLDFYKLIAIVGNGVDFFFVISGFCMYLMAGNKRYSAKTYLYFIKKRFLRIAPAFYVAIIVYGIIKIYTDPYFPLITEAIFHFAFLNNLTGSTISSPFWSIATEWDFYMILPMLLLMNKKNSLGRNLLLFSFISIMFYCMVNKGLLNEDFWQWQIFVRFPEFAVGMYAAYLYKKGKTLPRFFKGGKGLLMAVIIMYIGRSFKFTPFVAAAGGLGFFFKSIADTVMVSGFAILLLHVITQPTLISKFLSGKIITWLGRISYSVYLWHSLVIFSLGSFFIKLPFSNVNVVVAFICISLCTIMVSYISYTFLEAFYFNKQFRIQTDKVEERETNFKSAAL
jgi:peptidoglycan/LPS O-acetylase OafA/YrhL